MEDLGVLSSECLFFGLTSLWEAGEGIGNSICFALAVIDSEVVPGELLGPANLPGAQALGIHETAKVIMIGENEDFVLAAF